MRQIFPIAMLAPALLLPVQGQTGKTEFEVASIKPNAPQPGFHFAADSATGGPGTADPGMFRCSKCSLSTLIVKAFNLQPYQFPGRAALNDATYELQAKLPAGATEQEFQTMLQNLLRDRFSLKFHFQEKKMKGYHLVIAKNGSKLKESTPGGSPEAGGNQHGYGRGEAHSHSGVIAFGTSASYRAASQTTADLARILSDQVGSPVDDETGLPGRYDISLRWSSPTPARAGNHSDNGHSGGGYGGHDGGGGAPAGGASDPFWSHHLRRTPATARPETGAGRAGFGAPFRCRPRFANAV